MSKKQSGEYVRIETLTPDPHNANTHDARSIEAIARSLKQFGQVKPIVVDAAGVILAGNGTREAALSLGWESIWIVRTELTGDEARAFAIADNKVAEFAEWDFDKLQAQLDDLQAAAPGLFDAAGFDAAAMDELAARTQANVVVVEDELQTDPPVEPITQAGDLWLLGDHRLLCGDSTKSNDVARLMVDSQINVAVTSPPYASQRKYDESSGFNPIPPEEYVDWWELIQSNIANFLACDGSLFLNIKEHCEEGQRHLYVKDLVISHVRRWSWLFVDEFCWTHGGTPKAVVNRFKNGWEPIFQFTKSHVKIPNPNAVQHATDCGGNMVKREMNGGRSGSPNDEYRQGHKFRPKAVAHKSDSVPDWSGLHPSQSDGLAMSGRGEGVGGMQVFGDAIGARAARCVSEGMAYPSNVLSVGKNREALGHGAAFPVALPSFFIKAYSDAGDVVYDPFLGSGSTLIAAEQLNRRCFGLEISPAYCDVIVNRWQKLTGKTAARESK